MRFDYLSAQVQVEFVHRLHDVLITEEVSAVRILLLKEAYIHSNDVFGALNYLFSKSLAFKSTGKF